MECNKDEAIRAKKIAENKMGSNDFEGARKIALKAQNLYPEIENISQLISVCDVHCSAQRRLCGSEKDFYGILQVERLADVATVKKQYRRLALFLHPDKNRFPGAEAAFKLICEAHAVLSDSTKKSLYDSKIRVATGSASVNLPPYHMHRSFQFNKQYGSHHGVYTHHSSLHHHQPADPSFWTSCPFCSMKYQYHRKFVNTILHCQQCRKKFMGYETSAPPSGVPLGTSWVPHCAQQGPAKPTMCQTTCVQENAVPGRSKFKTGIHNVKGSSSKFDYQQTDNVKTVRTKRGGCTESAEDNWVASATRVDLKSKGTSNNVNLMHGGKCNSDANFGKRAKLNNKNQKRGGKHRVESSDSFDTSSDSDVSINENLGKHGNDPSSVSGSVHYPRRSTRKRQNISYHEEDDDDPHNHVKSSQGSKLSEAYRQEVVTLDGEVSENENQNHREMGSVQAEENVKGKDANRDKDVKKRRERGSMSNTVVDLIETESDSDHDSFLNNEPDDNIWQCPDPEFSDFDKNRAERCFAVNQFWACYDSDDGMPRYYAKVKKVRLSPFELSITWLEADPMDEASKKWRDAKFPVGCGIFRLGKTEKTSALPTFSHQIHCEGGKKRNSYVIYPRKGEVWALFKDWDLSWSSNPEKHKEYKYEIVEVLSEFDASCGIKVCNLDKVTGFVCLYERSSRSDTSTITIWPNEINKFSHYIPFNRMMGSERPGVPMGSFELDPASLPLNPDDMHCTGKGMRETKNINPGVNSTPLKSDCR